MKVDNSNAPFPEVFVARLRAHEASAWDEAFGRLWPIAVFSARRTLPAPATDADDVASAALADFARLAVLPGSWPECAAMVTVIARRRALSVLRQRFTGKRHALAIEPLGEHLASTLPEPAEVVATALDSALVLAELSELERELLEAHFVEGLNSQEIGARLGLNPATVRSHLSRTLQTLRRRWTMRDT